MADTDLRSAPQVTTAERVAARVPVSRASGDGWAYELLTALQDQTGPEIVTLLTALTGTGRLDAAALRDIADALDDELGNTTWRTGGTTGSDDGVVTGISIDSAGEVTITRSVGADVTSDFGTVITALAEAANSLTAEQEHELDQIQGLVDKTEDLSVENVTRTWADAPAADAQLSANAARPTNAELESGTYGTSHTFTNLNAAAGYIVIRIALAADIRDYRSTRPKATPRSAPIPARTSGTSIPIRPTATTAMRSRLKRAT